MKRTPKFVAIPEAFQTIAGEPDPGTRIYRREGTREEMVAWFDALCEHVGGCVSPGGAAVYAGVTRPGVHRRLKTGKLTAFCFHITKEKSTLFGQKKRIKELPIVYIPTSECRGWRLELEERVARIAASKEVSQDDEEAFAEADDDGDKNAWAGDFLNEDPKDKGRKNVRPPYPWENMRE